MRILLCLSAALLALSACGGGSSGGGSPAAPTKTLNPNPTSVTISGQIDLDGSTLDGAGTITVEVDGVPATVGVPVGDIYDWNATVPANTVYDSYRVEYFVNGNLVMAFDYDLDP